MIWDLCIVYLDSWLVESSWLLYILLWVPSWTCVTVATRFHPHNMYVSMCTLCLVGISKATSCRLWRVRYHLQGANFGASHSFDSPKIKSFGGLREEILWIWWLQNGVLQAWDEQLIGEEGGGVFIPPPPKNLTAGYQKSPAKAGVKSGYSRPHRLKPASTLALAGLKNLALARNSRTNSRVETEGFLP
jgi:hypothetical protein